MKGALFDLDGVLIDTEGTYSDFWSAMGDEYEAGIPDFANVIKGTTLAQILDKYFPPEMHAEMKQKLKKFEDEMEYRIFPGVVDFLSALRQRGFKTAIVTSSGEAKMSRLWAKHPDFKSFFDVIITDAQVQRSKPDPQGYLLAAQALGCDPKDCFVFEDSYNGLEAGRRSGAKVVALSTTNPAGALKDKADVVIGSFEHFTVDDMLQL